MPKTQEILAGLHSIANNYSWYAVGWHAVFYVFIFALIAQWQPSNQLFAVLMCIPLISVAVFAWITGNPFNGIMFTVMAFLIFIFGLKSPVLPIAVSQLPFMVIGTVMIAFGLIYPHFVVSDSIIKYFYASPVGLIPCPTLSVLIGFALLFNGFGAQSVSLTCIVFGLFYGIFGVIKLAVYLDLFLVFGALALLVKYMIGMF